MATIIEVIIVLCTIFILGNIWIFLKDFITIMKNKFKKQKEKK
jgi:hypothetical protein